MSDCNQNFKTVILLIIILILIIINNKNSSNCTFKDGFAPMMRHMMRPRIPVPAKPIIKKPVPGRKSLETFAYDNNITDILNKKLCDFWVNSSHNSFLEGYQVLGESRISNLSNALESGARCIELDIQNGVDTPLVMHTGSLPGYLSDYLSVIRDEAFKNTNDPLILYLEIFHSSVETHMKNIQSMIKSYLGGRLYEGTLNTYNESNYCFNVPIKKLLGKIVIVINYYNMNNGNGLEYRDKYLYHICHALSAGPEHGSLVDNVGADSDDSLKIKQSNKVIRVYPNNILTSSNYNPDPFWSSNYNFVSLNFGNDDDNLKKNNKKFKYCSFVPFDIIISENGTVNKPVQDVFVWDSERKAPLYSNINASSNIILPNKCYNNDTTWRSNDGKYFLRIQIDGNLVLYNTKNKPLWNSNTNGNQGAILHMQKDGNLVIYNTAGNRALWSSGTHGNPGAYAGLTDGDWVSDADFIIYNIKGEKLKKLY